MVLLQIIGDKMNLAAACLYHVKQRPAPGHRTSASPPARPLVECLSRSSVFPSISVDHNLIWQFKC